MLIEFKNLLDPATTLGAFLISIIAGIIVSFILGFFTGNTYTKKNILKLKKNDGVINIDSKINGGFNGKKE